MLNSTSMTISSNSQFGGGGGGGSSGCKTIRVHLPNQQKTTVLIKNGVTIRDALQKKMSTRGFQSDMCNIRVLNQNRQANWNDHISDYENQEIQITMEKQNAFNDLNNLITSSSLFAATATNTTTCTFTSTTINCCSTNCTTNTTTTPSKSTTTTNSYLPELIRVHLPNQQKTTVLAQRGFTVQQALSKSMSRHVLTSTMCDIEVVNQNRKVDWTDDISNYKNLELQIKIKERCPYFTLISHNFKRKTFFKLTNCDVCHTLLFQGFRCQTCSFKFHQRCANRVPPLCEHLNKNRSNSVPNISKFFEDNYLQQKPHSSHEEDDWKIDKHEISTGPKIGSGSFGTVFLGNWHGPVALKKFFLKNPSPDQLETFRNEVAVLKRTRHANIILFLGCVSEDEQLTIVTEWCEGSSLFKHLHVIETDFKLQQLMDISKQIALGMAYLHSRHILHRDLKSQNIFLRKDLTVKIGDFGLATVKTKWSKTDQINNPTGSILWMSPEVIRTKDSDSFSFKSDIYSYGIVLFEIFAQQLPYRKGDKNSLNNQLDNQMILYLVATGQLQPSLNKCRIDTPKMMINLIRDCIKFDKNDRPLFDQVLNTIESLIKSMPKINRSLSEPSLISSLNLNSSDISSLKIISWLNDFSTSSTKTNH